MGSTASPQSWPSHSWAAISSQVNWPWVKGQMTLASGINKDYIAVHPHIQLYLGWNGLEVDGYSLLVLCVTSVLTWGIEVSFSFNFCHYFILGMFQRLDKLRKNAFASVILFGTNNDSSISGIWVFRGQDLAFTVSVPFNWAHLAWLFSLMWGVSMILFGNFSMMKGWKWHVKWIQVAYAPFLLIGHSGLKLLRGYLAWCRTLVKWIFTQKFSLFVLKSSLQTSWTPD